MTTISPTKEAYLAIEQAYDFFNQRLFGGELPSCLVVFQRQPKMMGYVSHQRWINREKSLVDELAINPEYFLGYPLLEVLQTLVHEQCHIWQNHFGKPGRRSYHNKEWADKMRDVGLMPSTTGQPGGRRTGEHMNDYVIYGGQFQEACYELIQSGFTMPWLDRVAAKDRSSIAIYDQEGRAVQERMSVEEVAILAGTLGAELLPSVSSRPESASGESADSDEVVADHSNAAVLLETKKPTRVKYRCCSCGNQAWGKPGMNLLCGDCKITLDET